jgi:hypothetical protein
MLAFDWVPWSLSYNNGWAHPVGWFPLGAGRYISIGVKGLDSEERLVWSAGPLMITRLETAQECEERLEGEAEEAFMDRELNRYCEWSY